MRSPTNATQPTEPPQSAPIAPPRNLETRARSPLGARRRCREHRSAPGADASVRPGPSGAVDSSSSSARIADEHHRPGGRERPRETARPATARSVPSFEQTLVRPFDSGSSGLDPTAESTGSEVERIVQAAFVARTVHRWRHARFFDAWTKGFIPLRSHPAACDDHADARARSPGPAESSPPALPSSGLSSRVPHTTHLDFGRTVSLPERRRSRMGAAPR